MRPNVRPIAAVVVLLLAITTFFAAAPIASAQDTDEIVRELESSGYYIEDGADATDAEMRDLVLQARSAADVWYFVVLSGPAEVEYAATIRDQVRPLGNVIVHSILEDAQGLFDNVDFASASTGAIEEQALAAFDSDWDRPADYLDDVVNAFESLTDNATTSTTTDSSSGSDTSSNGGGFPWLLIGIPAVLIGGFWFMSRRGKKKTAETDLETAQKIRAELQTEIDELANDVLVLSGPVDLSEKEEAISYYREATDTYLIISDEIPDMEQLEAADLGELSELGARVTHARWQMDAAEAILDGEPIPEKPKVAPPPPPPTPPQPRAQQDQRRRQLPPRQPRPRVPYSPSRRRSGGGLLDILIAGAGTMASTRRGGGMFGGMSRGRSQPSRSRSTSQPRPGGGVFGGSSRSRNSTRSSSRRSPSSSTSRRRPSGRRSTSKRRRR